MYGDWLLQEWAGKVTQYLIQLCLRTSINACTYLEVRQWNNYIIQKMNFLNSLNAWS